MIARIAIDGAASGRLFDYAVPPELAASCAVGARVRVHFGHRAVLGYVADLAEDSDFIAASSAEKKPAQAPTDLLLDVVPDPPKPALKPVEAVDGDAPVILPVLMRLARWMAQYYLAPIERCIQTLLPAPVRSGRSREKIRLYVEAVTGGPGAVPAAPKLTKRQEELVADIRRVGGGWLQQVIAEFKCTAETLRRLEKLGAITIVERQMRRDPFANRRVVPSKPLPLNEDQTSALRLVLDGVAQSENASAPPPKPILLFGVTGSGKTEVYLQAIAAVLAKGRGAIVLVPEIALTPQTVQRVAARFGENIAVLHSALSDGERYD